MKRREGEKVVDLSVDFDFWIREDPMWDWGHRDAADDQMKFLFQLQLWTIRYGGSIDLHHETAIERFADFPPENLLASLFDRGFALGPLQRVGVANSHKHAFKFFGRRGTPPPDMLVNLDAHHDAWALKDKADCGNWLSHLHAKWPNVEYLSVYPSWKDPEMDGDPSFPLDVVKWVDLPTTDRPKWRIRNVFVCRSAEWVPPHHDDRFIDMAGQLAAMADGKFEYVEPLLDRSSVAMTAEEAAQARAERQRLVDEHMEERREEEAGG